MKWVDNGRRMAERAKELFPPGTRIQLIHMDDPYNPIPDGTRRSSSWMIWGPYSRLG